LKKENSAEWVKRKKIKRACENVYTGEEARKKRNDTSHQRGGGGGDLKRGC